MEQDWELVAANEVHVMDVLKKEGNVLFQQHDYLGAIQVYSRALEQLPRDCPPAATSRLTLADSQELLKLELAVRLNRALAYIELQDAKLVEYAEQDCTLALTKQPDCVKAWYRRALARERMENLKGALEDAEHVHALEPANPAAHELIARLQEAWSNRGSTLRESELSAALRQCAVDAKTSPVTTAPQSQGAMTNVALAAWQALQDQELEVRKTFKHTARSTLQRSGAKKKMKAPATTKASQAVAIDNRGISSKTDSLWATLTEEEESTVSSIYKRAGVQQLQTSIKTASIHPSR